KTPSYTKSVSWQHHPDMSHDYPLYFILRLFQFQYTNEMLPDCFLAQKLPDLVGPKFIHKVVLHNS
ncbi:TPA: hypothetical protein ACIJNM_004940, partial [Escherichia coli]